MIKTVRFKGAGVMFEVIKQVGSKVYLKQYGSGETRIADMRDLVEVDMCYESWTYEGKLKRDQAIGGQGLVPGG